MARVMLTCQELIAYVTISAGKKRIELEIDPAELEQELINQKVIEPAYDRE